MLDSFARHYQTGEADAPGADRQGAKHRSSSTRAMTTVEYLSSAIVDMDTAHACPDGHATPTPSSATAGAPRHAAGGRDASPACRSSATCSPATPIPPGYYSYLWSEVMDADTREAFEETGDVFDRTTADRMRKFILAPGNSTDRAEAYRQFRGRDPDVRALLEKRGFAAGN